MKETSFIAQNKEKWERYEKLAKSQTRDPEELTELYMDITDDLSYAQTFYKRRTIRVYLNQLAQRVYTGLHIQKRESLKKVWAVWTTSLPLEIYRSRKNLLFALSVFLIWVTIGAISTHVDPDFLNLIVGEEYVIQTNENIKNGNPLAIYESDDQLSMFIGITSNNIRVAIFAFIFGIFFTLGTHFILFQNGIMLGAFQYYFATKGLLLTSFLGIWIHGAFEISAIVLSGGAGIILGNGFLFPKSYTRLQSLQLAAKRGLKIMLSLIPFLIVAGFLESYVTHNYQRLPDWSKWALILFSFGLILFYYVIYPILVARKNPTLVEEDEVVNFSPNPTIILYKIRTFTEIFADSFRVYRLQVSKFFTVSFFTVLPVMLLLTFIQHENHPIMMQTQFVHDWSTQLKYMMGFSFSNLQDSVVCLLWSMLISWMFTAVAYSFQAFEKPFRWSDFFTFAKLRFFWAFAGVSMLYWPLVLLPWYWSLLAVFIFPFLYHFASVSAIEGIKPTHYFKRAWKFGVNAYGLNLLAILFSVLLVTIFMQPIAYVGSNHVGPSPGMRDLLDVLADFVGNLTATFDFDSMYWSNFTRQLIYLFFLLFVLPLIFIPMIFVAFSEYEKFAAVGLKTDFEKFGKRKRNQETMLDFES